MRESNLVKLECGGNGVHHKISFDLFIVLTNLGNNRIYYVLGDFACSSANSLEKKILRTVISAAIIYKKLQGISCVSFMMNRTNRVVTYILYQVKREITVIFQSFYQ